MESKTKKEKCLYPECESNTLFARGLCASHYRSARYLVLSKRITWKRLEEENKCLKVMIRGAHCKSPWFLNGDKP